jgi:acyl dehydratase
VDDVTYGGVDVDALQEGQPIPEMVRATGLDNWNRYAAVNDEFVPIHMDDVAGQAAGYPSAFGMGNLQWSYLHNVVRAWAGDEATIVKMSCSFRGPNIKGQTVTAGGVVRSIIREDDRTVVELDIWTKNQDGGPLAPGTATVAFPAGSHV